MYIFEVEDFIFFHFTYYFGPILYCTHHSLAKLFDVTLEDNDLAHYSRYVSRTNEFEVGLQHVIVRGGGFCEDGCRRGLARI